VGDAPAVSSGATDRTHVERNPTARGGTYGLLAAARHERGLHLRRSFQHPLAAGRDGGGEELPKRAVAIEDLASARQRRFDAMLRSEFAI
jgi:hypothetical protein